MPFLQVQAFAESPEGLAARGQDAVDILRYIVHGKTCEEEYPWYYPNGIRDKGRGSVDLSYFLCHRKAQVPFIVIHQDGTSFEISFRVYCHANARTSMS